MGTTNNPMSLILSKIEELKLWEKEIEFKRNDFIKTKGIIDTHLYYIEEGSLRVFVSDDDEEKTIRFGYKNNFITALDSFLNEKPSDFIIQAIRRTKIKSITKESFLSVINSSIQFQKLWNHLLEQLVLQQLEREVDLLTNSPIERYKRVLARSPQLFQEIPNKYIADYLRMTPETLSRIKKS